MICKSIVVHCMAHDFKNFFVTGFLFPNSPLLPKKIALFRRMRKILFNYLGLKMGSYQKNEAERIVSCFVSLLSLTEHTDLTISLYTSITVFYNILIFENSIPL